MQRRDFFKSIINIPLKRLSSVPRETDLSEADLFLEAMRYGIDPATLSPAELRKAVSRKRREAADPHQPDKKAAPS